MINGLTRDGDDSELMGLSRLNHSIVDETPHWFIFKAGLFRFP